MSEEDCDIWGEVDFGHGPVEVRCTVDGPHEDHQCAVLLDLPESQKTEEDASLRHNIFEEQDERRTKEGK